MAAFSRGTASEGAADHLSLPKGECVARILSRVLGRRNHSEGEKKSPLGAYGRPMGPWGALVRGFPGEQLATRTSMVGLGAPEAKFTKQDGGVTDLSQSLNDSTSSQETDI